MKTWFRYQFNANDDVRLRRKLMLLGAVLAPSISKAESARGDRQFLDFESRIEGGISTRFATLASKGGAAGIGTVEGSVQQALDARVKIDALAASSGSALVTFQQAGVGAVPRASQAKMREIVSVKDFGALGDGVTDDTIAIQTAANACAINGYDVGRGGPILVFPEAIGYRVTGPITVAAGVPVEMRNTSLLYGEASNITVLTLGQKSTRSFRCSYRGIDVRKDGNIRRGEESDVGVRFINQFFCEIEIRGVRGFCIGAQCAGVNPGEGFYYNRVSLGYFFGNKIGLDLVGGDGTDGGWCNENVFLGGEFQGGVVESYDRYGVRIRNAPVAPVYNDNNLFIKPSFEMNGFSGNASIPFLILHSHGLRTLNARHEGVNARFFAKIENNSKNTDIHVAHQQVSEDGILDNSEEKSTTLTCQKANWSYHGREIYLSPALGRSACHYDRSRFHVPGLNFYYRERPAEIGSSGQILAIEGSKISLGKDVALARMVDTSRSKKLVINVDANPGEMPWVIVQCFDRNGKVMAAPAENGPGCLAGPGFKWANSWQGYVYAASVALERLFTVDESIQSVRVGVYNGKLRGFSIIAIGVNNQYAATYSGYEDVMIGANIGVEPPLSGSWMAGKIIFNAKPSPGSPQGWVCIASGSPGIWKSMPGVPP